MEKIAASKPKLLPIGHNLKIRHLKAVFNYCIKQDWLTSTPLKRVELAPIRPKEIKTYTAEQVRTIMDTVATNHPEAVPFFAISFFAGTRPEEIMKLEWSAFTDDGQFSITAAVNKTRTKRFTTVTPTLQAWLDWYEARGGVREGRIFPRSRMTLIRIRRRVAEIAGVEWIQDGPRKTFASAILKSTKMRSRRPMNSGTAGQQCCTSTTTRTCARKRRFASGVSCRLTMDIDLVHPGHRPKRDQFCVIA